MHSYLRAIGFSKLEQKDLDQILQEVIVSCDEKKIAEQGKNEIFAELSRYFGMNIGLRVCGTSRISFGWNIIFRILPEAVSPVRKM